MKLKIKTLKADVPNVNGKICPLDLLKTIADNSQHGLKYNRMMLYAMPVNGEVPLDFSQIVGFVTDCFVEEDRLCFKISLFRPETGYNDLIKTMACAICPQIGGIGVNGNIVVDESGVHVMTLGTYSIGEVAEYYKDSIIIEEDDDGKQE